MTIAKDIKITDVPASGARIGYASDIATATNADEMLTKNTYERYAAPTGATTEKFQLTTTKEIDYIGLAAHNLATHDSGLEVVFSYAATVGGALIDIESVTPTRNEAIMVNFDAVTAAEIAITFNASTTGLELGVIYAGESLKMTQPIYGGHSPQDLAQKTSYRSTMSQTGNFLGRTVTRKGSEASFSWQFLDPDWFRSEFRPFMDAAITDPFFIQWRPDRYDTATFSHTKSDISPSNMGGGSGLMEVSISIVGHL